MLIISFRNTALLEKMAHFSSVITYGARRSSQWTKAYVIFSSSQEEKLLAISSIHTRSVAMAAISAAKSMLRIWKIFVQIQIEIYYLRHLFTLLK
jgi:L-rhamnose mutarotase